MYVSRPRHYSNHRPHLKLSYPCGPCILSILPNNCAGHYKKGTPIVVDVRGKMRRAAVAEMPFVEARYYRG